MAEPDQKIFSGRYELDRHIARGGMADVYLARDALLDRPVALKVLFSQFATDPTFVQRFRREAQAAANLNHPNIVSVYDWGEEAGTYFIVMEYVEGRSLAQIIRDEGPLHPDRAADVTADTAAALGFAHRNGVVHRDVKPGNILINPSGTVKVADFGIARAVSASENLTQTGTVMGTATYFSPEQARGETVDARTDVYSLGVVLYEMLTGRPPFSGDNPVSVAYKHVQETPRAPRQLNPDIPVALEAVTLKAMAKDPDARYATAEELRADLRRFRSSQPVTAPTVAAVTAQPPTEATQAVGSSLGATTAVPVDRGTRVVRQVEDTYPRDDAPRERRSSAGFTLALLSLLGVLAVLLFLFSRSLGLGGGGTTEDVEVPSVISLPAAEASRLLDERGLDAEITEEPNEQVPAGVVFAQDPAAGVNVREGATVQLRVSAGAPPVTVPSVVGLNLADAVSELEGRGLVVDVRPTESEDRPEGEVLSQEPDAGEEVESGSTVVLEASSGPPLVPVPDVVGLTSNQAGVELGRAGFEVSFQEEASTEPQGQVLRTDPPADTELATGEEVRVFTST
ncbi:MAG: Stk1 family PASTA domain-containing Ser/Thr kinase, partial [Acidimicrobiia bacterium]|nr:Stk1 family PASTA domain-containing Ser/Thr kinase [Acidimicrobiia bacterium]